MIAWITERKSAMIVFLLILVIVGGVSILNWIRGESDSKLTPPEQGALEFWKAMNVEGDAQKAKQLDANGDEHKAVFKNPINKVMIMQSPERPATDKTAKVFIYTPDDDRGYMLDMVNQNGKWKMRHYETDYGLYDYVAKYYPDHQHDWKEVNLK
ncbi:hypothetical protein [Thermoactinomyces sp. CICC 10521]|uniref:hypothetical protein n=1 Tax=Thermoactinomyces sp. CICC 10521 TaxID=2767426 RepID=UPI0018DE4529|nr:hypothetical protein [Thermoactinomyces sp. CICC 10521]MBH8608947.1 hypothetical protein [Thermoactinomyces sp. CICC 10521]